MRTRQPGPRIGTIPTGLGRTRFDRTLAAAVISARSVAVHRPVIVAPGESIGRAIRRLGRDGGTIMLANGRWPSRQMLTISTPNVTIVGSARSVLIRRIRPVPDTRPLIYVTADNVRLINLTFDDSVTQKPCIEFDGVTGGLIEGCRFIDCYKAVELDGATGIQVHKNFILACRNGRQAVGLVAASECIVSYNEAAAINAAESIYGDDTSARCSFVGNAVGSGGTLSYKGGLGSNEAGTTPDTGVTVR